MIDWENRLEQIRERLKMNNKSLEATLALSNGYIGDLFRGKNNNPGKLIVGLIEKLGINPNWLFYGDGEMLQRDAEGNPVVTRPFVPAQQEATRKVPLIRQKASAGPGAEWNSGDNVEAYLDPLDLLPSLAHLKPGAFRVAGSSMAGAGISDGDVVLFDPDGNGYYPDDFYVFALDGDVYVKHIVFEPLTGRADIFSVFEHEGQRLLKSLDLRDEATLARFRMIGRVVAWLHDNTIRRKSYPTARAKTSPETREKPLENR